MNEIRHVQILWSERQSGNDPVIAELVRADWAGARVTVRSTEEADFPKHLAESDLLLLYGAIEPYLANRFNIPGRPWVCAASFWFQDLYGIYRNQVPLQDTGLKAILTNCGYYVETAGQHVPARFCWAPMPRTSPLTPKRVRAGTVLPNLEDRDFSLVLWAHKFFAESGEFIVFRNKHFIQKLPAALEDCVVNYDPSDPDRNEMYCYQSLQQYIPAPRLTDYRYKVVPREILRAIRCGATPMLIRHPVVSELDRIVQPTFVSLTAMEKALRNRDVPVRAELPSEMTPSVQDFVDAVRVAYQRWHANASA